VKIEISAGLPDVTEKLNGLLHDPYKISQFKVKASSFLRSESSATEFVDNLWDIFNIKLDEFGKVITAIADSFDDDASPKPEELLGAWHEWKISSSFLCSNATEELIRSSLLCR
jgi:hypothetical protein